MGDDITIISDHKMEINRDNNRNKKRSIMTDCVDDKTSSTCEGIFNTLKDSQSWCGIELANFKLSENGTWHSLECDLSNQKGL